MGRVGVARVSKQANAPSLSHNVTYLHGSAIWHQMRIQCILTIAHIDNDVVAGRILNCDAYGFLIRHLIWHVIYNFDHRSCSRRIRVM